jgi:S1-C subfamily serine protease
MKATSILVPVVLTLIAAPVAAAEESLSLPDLFRMVDPAVVEIATVQQMAAEQGPARRVKSGGLGSGFLISEDGRIMTASHVVQVADELQVRFVTGDVVKARVLASDPSADVALIQAESVPSGIKPAALGDSTNAAIGDQIFVIGAPYGIAHSLSVGHISGRRTPTQLFGGFEQVELLQTDAAINQGNSGGPMFNMRGEVIGIVSHIFSTSGGSMGLGFVVTSNLAMRVLIDDPTTWTGLDGVLVEGQLAAALNIPQAAGIVIEAVAAGSPASAIGLRPGNLKAQIGDQTLSLGGDIVLSIHGIRVGETDFEQKMRERGKALGKNDKVVVTVLRRGEIVTLSNLVHVLYGD